MSNLTNTPNREITEAVMRMNNYIAEHIKEPITQQDLAKVANYSPYYSTRIFKEVTGKSPFEYIRKLRLSQAAIKLHEENVRVLDVALEFVFNSHEGFTRAFAKEFGVTPKHYAKTLQPLNLFMPFNDYDLQKIQKKVDNNMSEPANTIFVQIMERPARKLILKRAKNATEYFSFCEEVGCSIWEILCGIKEALFEPIGMWMPNNLRPEGTSLYTQGVEVPIDYTGAIPTGFETLILPPCKMLIMQGQPYDDENFAEAIAFFWQQTANFNPEIYGYEWANEEAPRFQLAPMGYRGYIEGRPVKKVTKD